MFDGMTGRTGVVPFEAIVDIARDSHVMPRRVRLAAKDVDEPLSDSAHAGMGRTEYA